MSAVRLIYAGTAALGMREDEDRRAFYMRVTGKERLRQMSGSEKEAVVSELRRLGFQPVKKAKVSGPYAPKLQALWISAWNLGLTAKKDDSALLAFVQRQTGLAATRFLTEPAEAEKVIEALKQWLARDGGVVWNVRSPCPEWLKRPTPKVALAQWIKLGGQQDAGFAAAVRALIGDDQIPLARLSDGQWRVVVTEFGTRIRARKGGKG